MHRYSRLRAQEEEEGEVPLAPNSARSAKRERRHRKHKRRRNYGDEDEDAEDFESDEEDRDTDEILPRWKIITVFAAIGICFALLFPNLFGPLFSTIFGRRADTAQQQHQANPHHPYMDRGPGGAGRPPRPPGPPPHRGPMPQMAGAEIPQSGGRGGMMSWMLPIYTVGVMAFLIYTLFKMNRKKKKRRRRYDDSDGSLGSDDETDVDGFGRRKLRTIQARLRETEEAMAKILEQLEEVAQAAPEALSADELRSRFAPEKLRETELNLAELNRLNELRNQQRRQLEKRDISGDEEEDEEDDEEKSIDEEEEGEVLDAGASVEMEDLGHISGVSTTTATSGAHKTAKSTKSQPASVAKNRVARSREEDAPLREEPNEEQEEEEPEPKSINERLQATIRSGLEAAAEALPGDESRLPTEMHHDFYEELPVLDERDQRRPGKEAAEKSEGTNARKADDGRESERSENEEEERIPEVLGIDAELNEEEVDKNFEKRETEEPSQHGDENPAKAPTQPEYPIEAASNLNFMNSAQPAPYDFYLDKMNHPAEPNLLWADNRTSGGTPDEPPQRDTSLENPIFRESEPAAVAENPKTKHENAKTSNKSGGGKKAEKREEKEEDGASARVPSKGDLTEPEAALTSREYVPQSAVTHDAKRPIRRAKRRRPQLVEDFEGPATNAPTGNEPQPSGIPEEQQRPASEHHESPKTEEEPRSEEEKQHQQSAPAKKSGAKSSSKSKKRTGRGGRNADVRREE